MKVNKTVGMNTYWALMDAEAQAKTIGFKFVSDLNGDLISLRPADPDSLPIFTRDVSLFSGELGEVQSFIRGIEWARKYDEQIRLSNSTERERKEQDVRNQLLAKTLKA